MQLRDIVRALTRRFWLLIIGTGLAVLGSYLAFRYLAPWPRYEASARAIVSNNGLISDRASLETNNGLLTTYVEWATRRPVLEGVIYALDLPLLPEDLRRRIDARVVGNTQMIEISVIHDRPDRAADIVNQIMRQLETEIDAALADEGDLPSASQEEILQLEEQVNSTAAELGTLTDQLLETASSEEADLLARQINVLQSNLDMWRRQYADATAEFDNRPQVRLIVVEEAQPPVRAVSPLVNVLVAGLAGLAATSLLSLLLAAPDTSGEAVPGSDES